jgi:hypothetical protein
MTIAIFSKAIFLILNVSQIQQFSRIFCLETCVIHVHVWYSEENAMLSNTELSLQIGNTEMYRKMQGCRPLSGHYFFYFFILLLAIRIT